MARSINQAGLDLVKTFEGFRAECYVCPAGVLTIGYGHTGSDVSQGQVISEEQAEELLRDDLASSCRAVERLIEVDLNDNQFAALASFTFNAGAGNLGASTLRKKLNVGNYDAVPSELARWTKATDPVTGRKRDLAGLVRRRAAEGELWLTAAGEAPRQGVGLMPQAVTNVDAGVAEVLTGGLPAGAAPTLQQITAAMKKLKYEMFDGVDRSGQRRNYDVNVFGVRNEQPRPNTFDDWVGVYWMDWEDDAWAFHVWPATTDPGEHWLQNPMNVKGTAILKEGQHRSSHALGLHQGKYQALVQNKPLPVFRDDDRDEELDFLPGSIDVGMHGINIHRASAHRRSRQVDRWSAGCQVLADPTHFATLIDICGEAAERWGPTFSYTLLKSSDL